MLFQEVPAKELLERFSLREAPICEGDERQYYTNLHHGGGRHVCCTGKLDNGNWLAEGSISRDLIVGNALSLFTDIVIRGDQDDDNVFHHEFSLNDSSFNELTSFLTAPHAQYSHNRKLYFDPMYGNFRPIYYDGDTKLLRTHNLKPERLNDRIRNIILQDGFAELVMNEFVKRAGSGQDRSELTLERLDGRTSVSIDVMQEIINELVSTVRSYESDANEAKMHHSYDTSNGSGALLNHKKKIKIFNKHTPYLFATRDLITGQGLLCILRPNYQIEKLAKLRFEKGQEVTLKKLTTKFS